MENNARENFIQIITQLEKVLCDESHKTILNVDQHLNSINIKKSLKLGVVSALKDNLNKSLSLVFRVLEEKLEKKVFFKVFDQEFNHFDAEIEESPLENLRNLEDELEIENFKKQKHLLDIDAGKNHLKELKEFIQIIDLSESSASEETLLKQLKSN